MKNFKIFIATGILTSFFIFNVNSFASDYVDDAQKYFEKGDYKAAVIQLKNRLKENPEDVSARLLLGETYLKTGNIKQADKEITRVYQVNPANEEIILTYANLLLLQGKYKKVNEMLNKNFSDSEKETQRMIYKAYAFLGQNQLAEAKQIFSEMASQDNKENVQVFNGLAKIAFLEKELNIAEEWLSKSLKVEPDNTEALQLRAGIEFSNKNYEKALVIYNNFIEKDENNLSLYLKRADIKIQLKNFDGAKKDIKKVLDKIKQHPQANFMIAQINLQEKNFKDAQKAAQNVLNVIPSHYDSMLILGIANFGLGNFNQADKYLTQYLSEHPNNIIVQNILANVYLAQNQGEQAILILESIDEEKRMNNAAILMSLGSSYLLTGESQKGIFLLNKAKELEPGNNEIKKRLISVQLKTGDFDSVISGLEEIIDKDQSNKKIDYMLIVSYIQKKQIEKAESFLKELLQKSPEDPALYNLSAVVENLKGNSRGARDAYHKAIKLNDKYISAYIGLAELSMLQKDWISAKTYFLKVAEIDPNYIKVYIYLAAIAELQNDQKEMEKQLKIGLTQAKGNVKSQVTLANLLSKLYLKQKAPEKIMLMAKELNRNYPNDKAALSFLFSAQIVNNKKKQAEQTLKIINNNDTSDVKHRLLLANLLSQTKGNETEVLELLDEVINISPDNSKMVLLKVVFLLKNKQYQQAREVANYAKEQFPNLALGYQMEGDTYRMELKLDKALISYQEAYKVQPRKKLLFIIAAIQSSQGKNIESLKTLERGLKNNDKDLEIYLKIAGIYQNSQRYDMAVKYYLQILEIKNDNLLALNNLAWVYAQEKNPQAIIYARKAYEKAPKSVAIIDTYGYIHIKQGNMAEGIKLLEKAITLSPEVYDIQYHLAEGYYLNGENEKAKVLLKSLLSKKTEFSEKENAKKLYSRLK